MGFPRKARITRGAELQRIAREGKRIRTRYIEVRATSPLAHSEATKPGVRIGLIIPRFRHSAVKRNQLKRRLRELARLQLVPLPISMDLVMRIRPDAYDATFAALTKDVEQVLKELDRWGRTTGESSVNDDLKMNTPDQSL